MSRMMKLLIAMLLLVSVHTQAQMKHANQKDMGKLYQALFDAAVLPADRDSALALANTPVTIELDITKDGTLIGTEVLTGTGTAIDDRLVAAINKFKKWNPSTMDGKKIADKVKFNMHFNEISEFRTGRSPEALPKSVSDDMLLFVEQNVTPIVADQLEGVDGRVTFKVMVDPQGAITKADVVALFVTGCGNQISELIAKSTVKFPESKAKRPRTYTFSYLMKEVDGSPIVYNYTDATPIGGLNAFQAYINKSVDVKLMADTQFAKALFDVTLDGEIKNVRPAGSVSETFDAQFVKALSDSQRWLPATINGVPVQVDQSLSYGLMKNGQLRHGLEERASFPGGNDMMIKYLIVKFANYKEEIRRAINENYRLKLRLEIGVDGDIKSHGVVYGNNESIKNMVNEIVDGMPNWTAGKQNGMYVTSIYTLPINLRGYTKKK